MEQGLFCEFQKEPADLILGQNLGLWNLDLKIVDGYQCVCHGIFCTLIRPQLFPGYRAGIGADLDNESVKKSAGLYIIP